MDVVSRYFSEEKKESTFFLFVGFLTIAISIFYLTVKREPFFNGISYAFVAIGLVQLVVGLTIYMKSDMDTVRVNHYIEREKMNIKNFEIPRMEEVMRNFVIYRCVEIALIVVGILFIFLFGQKSLGHGLGIGLVLQSSIMLVLDYFAEKRGKEYLSFLTTMSNLDYNVSN
ncbi:MAG: hypothetical protein IPP30_00705 [Flavobacterium sp.]|nr:hypothetical protein [Flavobacterium sp.]